MVSDSINASIPSVPKDFGKKKRANRSAKLKQCKLDARREQWLSQGAVKSKGCREELMGPRGLPQQIHEEGRKSPLENLQMRGLGGRVGEDENENGSSHHDFDSDSPSNSPTGSSVLGGNDSGTNFTASISGSSTSGSSVGCCSGCITEEDEEGDDNCLDDWEAMADALAANDDDNKLENHNDDNNPCLELQSSPEHEPIVQLDDNLGSYHENLTEDRRAPLRVTSGNSRAWRPDDALRPQSLPNLSKQHSFPNTDRHYGQGVLAWGCASGVNVPSACPICTEDLDFTDASFRPCSCGFQVCLFCHKKMLELDGRCPNCRELYKNEPVEVEASVLGGSLTLKLARSCSMRS